MSDEQQVVTVFQATQPLQIGMVKSALEQAEIPFTVANDVVSSVTPTDGMLILGFQVLAPDAERAMAVIRGLGFEQRRPPRIAREAQREAAAEEAAPPEAGETKAERPAFEMAVRIPPAEVMQRISRALSADGATPSAARGRGVEGIRGQAAGLRFRVCSRHLLFAASCTGRIRASETGSLVRASFVVPGPVTAGVILWLGGLAALLLVLALAGLPSWLGDKAEPVRIVVSAVSLAGLFFAALGKFLSAWRERRLRAQLEGLFADVAVPRGEQR